MGNVLGSLGAKIAVWVAGFVGAGGILLLLKKILPGLIRTQEKKLLEHFLNLKDGDLVRAQLLHNLVVDLVKLAEHEIPDAGQGGERYLVVSRKLTVLFPVLHGQEEAIRDLIEAAVVAVDNELKAASEK